MVFPGLLQPFRKRCRYLHGIDTDFTYNSNIYIPCQYTFLLEIWFYCKFAVKLHHFCKVCKSNLFSSVAGSVEENLRSLRDKNYKLINEKS
jgi:hypothetical protein